MSDTPLIAPLGSTRDLAEIARARQLAGRGDAEAAAKKFEALLATQLVKEMRKGISDGFFGGGAGSDVFEGWFDEHLGQALAAGNALDLAGSIRVSLGQKNNPQPTSEEQP